MIKADCRHTEGPHHDCLYVDSRKAKIHPAEVFARTMARAAGESGLPAASQQVDGAAIRLFHARMNQLMHTPNYACEETGAHCHEPAAVMRRRLGVAA